MADIKNRKIGVLATNGFEQAELAQLVKALRAQGAEITFIAPEAGEIHGMNHHEKRDPFPGDLELSNASVQDYDALLLPGGVANLDSLRTDKQAVAFIKHFTAAKNPSLPSATADGH